MCIHTQGRTTQKEDTHTNSSAAVYSRICAYRLWLAGWLAALPLCNRLLCVSSVFVDRFSTYPSSYSFFFSLIPRRTILSIAYLPVSGKMVGGTIGHTCRRITLTYSHSKIAAVRPPPSPRASLLFVAKVLTVGKRQTRVVVYIQIYRLTESAAARHTQHNSNEPKSSPSIKSILNSNKRC
jgi:hypothetical protein